MISDLSPITVVRVIEAPARETGAADFLLGALSLAGVLGLLSVAAGLLVGLVFIWFRNARPENSFNGQASERFRLRLDSGSH